MLYEYCQPFCGIKANDYTQCQRIKVHKRSVVLATMSTYIAPVEVGWKKWMQVEIRRLLYLLLLYFLPKHWVFLDLSCFAKHKVENIQKKDVEGVLHTAKMEIYKVH